MFWKKKRKKTYKCSVCGKTHKDWPALTFNSPNSYFELSEAEKKSIAMIDSDLCKITYEDQTDRFIRVVLKQKILASEQILNYGLWVSLSEKSWNNYITNFNNENHEEQYFGWLDNRIKEYENTLNIPMSVITQKGNNRPEIIPHDDYEHPFVVDYHNGISLDEAFKRIHKMTDNSE